MDTAGVSVVIGALLQENLMSEKPVTVEFGIIHDWDPEAANDDCYVTSSDSIENRTGLNWSLDGWHFYLSPSNLTD